MTRAPAEKKHTAALHYPRRNIYLLPILCDNILITKQVEKNPFARYSLTVLSIFEKKNNVEEENRQVNMNTIYLIQHN